MAGRRLGTYALSLLLLPGLAACATTPADTTQVSVHAAASLRVPFEALATTFEERHPGVEVALTFAGSSDLAAQILHGADVDVFAAADTTTMDRVVADELVEAGPELFAANALQIAVPPGNPARVVSLRDLTRGGVVVVVCAPEVPCGAATQRVEEEAGVALQPASEERSVTDVVTKVTTGEADAGLVYVTDVLAAGERVEGIALPTDGASVTRYPIATLAASDEPDLAEAFVELVLSETGWDALAAAGFARP